MSNNFEAVNKSPILSSLTRVLNGLLEWSAVSMCFGHLSHLLRYFSSGSLPRYSNRTVESRRLRPRVVNVLIQQSDSHQSLHETIGFVADRTCGITFLRLNVFHFFVGFAYPIYGIWAVSLFFDLMFALNNFPDRPTLIFERQIFRKTSIQKRMALSCLCYLYDVLFHFEVCVQFRHIVRRG